MADLKVLKRERSVDFKEMKVKDRTMRRLSEVKDLTPLEKAASKRRRKSTFKGLCSKRFY
jgi:hypothetical protein